MKWYVYYLFLCTMLFVSTSCLRQQAPEARPTALPKPKKAITLSEPEALALSDLPVPLGFHLMAYEPHFPTAYYKYQGSLELANIEEFVRHDAERNGWFFNNLATAHIKAYLITKPGKIALVMPERKNQTSQVHINVKTVAT